MTIAYYSTSYLFYYAHIPRGAHSGKHLISNGYTNTHTHENKYIFTNTKLMIQMHMETI
jgi:hypothetical protein